MGLAGTVGGGTPSDLEEASPELAREVLVRCLGDFPQVQLTVTGACMAPALRPGDVVTLVSPAHRRPRPGDIVLFAVPDGFRLHRLLWAPAAGGWRTKADSAPTWDAASSRADIIATARDVRSGAGVRGTRSATRLLRSWVEVAAAHVRAAWRSRHRG